ncbi:NADP oxidoreductase [Chryseobacterium sp. 6424]|uniref:Rossmann-like and DUF2520 domain-containing protein n=1 Tax=Chryseobacterium sp. 6424 TaxID=2039166 RepID=UPI000EFB60DF|nr:DUF2520 domain-containing protein [Chryseobacterium sp. 6424]AYO58745.1 NADP oxidoreductase [Chryseobacterium sp. 6424]
MKTVILGSGNVAYHLAKAFTEKNIPIVQVFGRNEAALKEISSLFNIPHSTSVLADADLYLIAVKDDAVAIVSEEITKKDCLVAHTSGSLPKEILKGNYRKASFYPLQTFSKTKNLVYEEIPIFIESDDAGDLEILKNLAANITEKIVLSTYEKRKYLHLTAVFACNFVNHLYARAQQLADEQQIPFEYFWPLIEETTLKIKELPPKEAQTGPAVRNDLRILQLHEELISDENSLEIYRTMNQSIKKMYEL